MSSKVKYAPCTFNILQPYNYTFKPFRVNRRRAATPGAMLCCHSQVLHYLSSLYSKLLVTLQINLYMLTNTTVHIPITIHMFLSFQFILNLIIVNRIKCINIQFFVLKLYKYTEIKRGLPTDYPLLCSFSMFFSNMVVNLLPYYVSHIISHLSSKLT